jgi:predicted dehydrogenase
MPILKLGLIGCGEIVQLVHLDILRQLSSVELVALAEPNAKIRIYRPVQDHLPISAPATRRGTR